MQPGKPTETEAIRLASAESDSRPRLPGLDGLRGIAVLLVVLSHIAWPGFGPTGSTGVTVFFTLSGFLITALLLAEHDRTGRIDLKAFWLRRGLRLFLRCGSSPQQ